MLGKLKVPGVAEKVVRILTPEFAAEFDDVIAVHPAQGIGERADVVAAALAGIRCYRRT